MNMQKITRTLKLAAIAAVAGFVGVSAAQSTASAASPYRNTDRINSIIHQLDPGGWSYNRPYKHYRQIPSYGYGYKKHYGGQYDYGYNNHSYSNHSYKDHDHNYSYGYDYSYKQHDNGYNDHEYNYRGMNLSVYFARGSNRLTWKGKSNLNDLGYALTSHKLRHAIYRIAGHTDARGDAWSNQILSEQRARAVKRYLVRQFGVNPRRLMTVGFGESRLLNSYSPYSSINRRVEVTLIANSYADLPYNWYAGNQ